MCVSFWKWCVYAVDIGGRPRPIRVTPAMERLTQMLGDEGVATLERELSSGKLQFEELRRQFSSMEYGGGSSPRNG